MYKQINSRNISIRADSLCIFRKCSKKISNIWDEIQFFTAFTGALLQKTVHMYVCMQLDPIPMRTNCIGGHSVRYTRSAISDWAWYRNVRYRTEERRVRHNIEYRNKLLSDIRYPTFIIPRSAVVSYQTIVRKVVGLKPGRKIMRHIFLLGSLGNDLSILDIGISDIDLVRYRNERI